MDDRLLDGNSIFDKILFSFSLKQEEDFQTNSETIKLNSIIQVKASNVLHVEKNEIKIAI